MAKCDCSYCKILVSVGIPPKEQGHGKLNKSEIYIEGKLLGTGTSSFSDFGISSMPSKPTLTERVASDINAILADIEWENSAPRELPRGDISTYDVAHEIAIRTCPHDALNNTMYGREWQCMDCSKIFNLQDVLSLQNQKRSKWPW